MINPILTFSSHFSRPWARDKQASISKRCRWHHTKGMRCNARTNSASAPHRIWSVCSCGLAVVPWS